MQNYIKSLRNDSSKLVRIDATISTVTSVENSDNYFELVKYLNNMSDQPTGLLKQAQLYIKIGRNDLAEDMLKKMVTWDPSAVSYSLLGQFYHANNQKIKAIESYTKASLIDPNNAEYPYTIALLLAEDSKVSEAILYLEKAVQLQPDFGRAWYNLGLAYAEQDKLKKAISALDRARTYLPNLPEIPYALATVYLRLGDLKQAQIAITECLKIDANYQPARELLKSPQE
jgi:tetratricopeptide (TPR) repeat protein